MKTTRLLFLATLLLAGSVSANAQTVRGRVVHQSDNSVEPVSNLRVRLCAVASQRCSHPVYTGRDGMYYLHNIRPGTYLLEVWASKDQRHRYRVRVLRQRYTDVSPIKLLPSQGNRGSGTDARRPMLRKPQRE